MHKLSPKICHLKSKTLVGISTKMSIFNNKTAQLWGQFGPKIIKVENKCNSDKISLQIYPDNYFKAFSPTTEFTKWACVEVSSIKNLPENCEQLIVQAGDYAVFNYKGSSQNTQIFEDIFTKWLPNSEYLIDNRPHFEILGDKYKNNDADSEEEIWIPIKKKIRS